MEEDDVYDIEEEEYLAICNEYKENEENDFMISESGNHLILPAVSQFDAKDESENVIDNNEEDNVSSEATEIDHEEEPNALNLQMVIVKGKTHVVEVSEDCEFDNEEERKWMIEVKNPEVVELEVNFMKLEYEIKSLKDEVEASKLRATALVKENTYIKLERDMAMERIEDLKNMLKQMIHFKDAGKDISSKENDTILSMKKFIFDDENMHQKYDKTPHNETLGECVSGVKSIETCDEFQTSKKNNSQKSHEGIHDGEPVYDETPQTISSIINKDAQLDSKQWYEDKNQTEEDSGEVDINKLIKENNILDAKSEKTPVGFRIGVSNFQSPLTITGVEKVEFDVGNKQREEGNRKLQERFCSPYVDREGHPFQNVSGL
ncbi:hypothetical protein L1987_69172 [Smallanthus sonchifolius]|uniref:Uncharacterized protein n=1 Tax=Smallanthus sonchifolius TaxID=185202 RepID=A0ACB9B609_9ASTR|nr:hypothetical protein L1987_69172 [Smallanthus sonchifolius]